MNEQEQILPLSTIYPGQSVPNTFQRSAAMILHPPSTQKTLHCTQRQTDQHTNSGTCILIERQTKPVINK